MFEKPLGSTEIVEKLGTEAEIKKKYHCEDPEAWAKKRDSKAILRALSVLAEQSDYIQERLYSASRELIPRKTGVLYYDCTNFFFEIEEEKGNRKYGHSKENRPNPIVQMGLFMDRSGLPLAFTLAGGSQNEQLTMVPLEKQILQDFGLSRFVVCTDSGLSSDSNRKFNNFGERSFITVQSIKKMPKRPRTASASCFHPALM